MELSVMIPAYREEEALDLLLPKLKMSINSFCKESQILIVDSESPLDGTEAICKREGVEYLRRTGGNTYGDAIRSGIRAAQGKYILVMDADGSHNPEQLIRLWTMREGKAVVIGSRYIEGGQTENPAALIFMSWLVNVSYRFVFGLRVKDVSNSLRIYNADKLKSISLKCDSFDIVEEILIKIADKSHWEEIVEVPISFERRKRGESKRSLIKFIFAYLMTMIRLYRLRRDS